MQMLGRSTLLPGSLGFYKNHSSNLNLSAPGLFVISDEIDLWVLGNNGAVHKTSFSVIFTMSMYQPKKVNGNLGLIFAMIPQVDFYNSIAMHRSNSYWYPTSIPYSAPLAGNQVMVQAGAFSWISANDTIICLKISMEPMSSTVGDTGMVNYRISVDFIPLQNQMSIQVSVDAEGQQNPASFKAIMPLNSVDYGSIWPYGIFTFSSSMGQLLKLHFWNLTVERFSKNQAKKGFTIIILSTVLGSAAATAVTAAIVYWYFNSKYRRYKKDLDQLAKSMRLLPGMPTKFIFADIKKATRNFHESMRLGQGGFGAVYRCKLPPDKKGEMIEVAVKKFSTNDSRFYEDFLAEVSVINRLRHKNIIPLVGWCYNKGEPLLVYEYMPNGSLDQHLFHISGSPQQHPTHIHQWETRYNIVKDIATGLHYIHHEYEPIVLHRDIKSNNIMIDSTFQARLGDFGLACVVDNILAPEYVLSGKATTKSDIFAFGVLILEIVTGKMAVNMQCSHVTDWVWHLHQEDTLLGAVDPILTTDGFEANDAKRLLLLGLACSSPNPSERPTMVEALQIITKSAPPPDVPLEKPRFVWPQEEGHSLNSGHSTQLTILDSSLTMEVEMTGGGQASCGKGNPNPDSMVESISINYIAM
ncbi:unnamed protein product [Urochloa decumbens]|uniref:Protein kinase domain-containing protein n=1 Tax=Urochloa decumbens TaxID=240449 RepID=A0ABC9DB84_9POAL